MHEMSLNFCRGVSTYLMHTKYTGQAVSKESILEKWFWDWLKLLVSFLKFSVLQIYNSQLYNYFKMFHFHLEASTLTHIINSMYPLKTSYFGSLSYLLQFFLMIKYCPSLASIQHTGVSTLVLWLHTKFCFLVYIWV